MILVPPLVYEILKRAQELRPLDDIARELGHQPESLMRYIEEGRAKGLFHVERRTVERYELTEEGRRRAAEGLPEYKLLKSAMCVGEVCVVDLAQPEADVALANLAKLGGQAQRAASWSLTGKPTENYLRLWRRSNGFSRT